MKKVSVSGDLKETFERAENLMRDEVEKVHQEFGGVIAVCIPTRYGYKITNILEGDDYFRRSQRNQPPKPGGYSERE